MDYRFLMLADPERIKQILDEFGGQSSDKAGHQDEAGQRDAEQWDLTPAYRYPLTAFSLLSSARAEQKDVAQEVGVTEHSANSRLRHSVLRLRNWVSGIRQQRMRSSS